MKTSNVPLKVPMMEPVVKIASGKKQTNKKTVRSCGTSFFFFLGCYILTCGLSVHFESWTGNDHLVLVTLDGNLYSAGTGEQGQLGRVPELFSCSGGRKGLGEQLKPFGTWLYIICALCVLRGLVDLVVLWFQSGCWYQGWYQSKGKFSSSMPSVGHTSLLLCQKRDTFMDLASPTITSWVSAEHQCWVLSLCELITWTMAS